MLQCISVLVRRHEKGPPGGSDTQPSISKAQVTEIVKRTRAGESRAAIRDAMQLPERVVAKVQCARGLTASREDVVARDKEIVKHWLANSR